MDGSLACDPLEAVGPLCASIVLSFLGPGDLARCGAVSRNWRARALLDGQLWAPHLAKLWDGKVYVPTALRELAQASPHRAYCASLRDAVRQLPTDEELCAFTWRLIFKSSSWFSAMLGLLGSPRRFFNPNHTITAPPDDPLWGEVEAQRHYWYFRPGPGGATVLQVNTYPHLVCSRNPDWGWELSNAMVTLTIDSASGPNPGIPPGHPAARSNLSLAEIEARFNAILLEMDEDSDDDDDDDDDDGEDSSDEDEDAGSSGSGGDRDSGCSDGGDGGGRDAEHGSD